MIKLTDKNEIRRLLNRDRDWSLYALADLDDGLFEQCDWFGHGDGLVLVFRGIAIRPIFVIGDAAATRELLSTLPAESGWPNLLPDQLAAAREFYRFEDCRPMRRMILDSFRPVNGVATEPLTRAHCAEIESLYATGDGGGTAFGPFQLDDGFFRGIRRNGQLIAAAGTQVVSRREGVAAVGNIFTHPTFRGQGLAQALTSAVVGALLEAGIPTIGLNVGDGNAAAIHAYERVGFRTRLEYFEGPAVRLKS